MYHRENALRAGGRVPALALERGGARKVARLARSSGEMALVVPYLDRPCRTRRYYGSGRNRMVSFGGNQAMEAARMYSGDETYSDDEFGDGEGRCSECGFADGEGHDYTCGSLTDDEADALARECGIDAADGRP